jgi:HTH-type transcriptional regulator, glycine betaine synthesis regulator
VSDSELPEANTPPHAAPLNPQLRRVHDSMLDGLGQLAAYFGFSKVIGQLYGTLLLSAEPLSLDDMMERLHISKAGVSMNMRTLEHLGMVRQVWVRGKVGRRKYYEAETNYWQVITGVLTGREMRDVERAISIMNENSQQLERAMERMNHVERQAAALYIERMNQIEALFQFARFIISTILSKADGADFGDISDTELNR